MSRMTSLAVLFGCMAAACAAPHSPPAMAADAAPLRQAERLDRGAVAIPTSDGVLVSWRLLGSDPDELSFDVYRNGRKLNEAPLHEATNWLDAGGEAGDAYEIRPRLGSRSDAARDGGGAARTVAWQHDYLDVPLQPPQGGTTPADETYTYRANDASVGDVDGDGQYEIILKWDPSNSKDNSQSGYTGEVYLDAYKLDGRRLWRINLGRNIRAGAHYTQFLVYDFDGDGKAEVVAKTADGSVDGVGTTIGDANADYRNSDGYVLDGPEYLTVFSGETGAALATIDYVPPRGTVCDWGDCYGNRVDRFLAAVAYLDGERPSIVMTRGYYTRTVLAAFDWRDGKLVQRWCFDSDEAGSEYTDQGNHNLAVADVDGDGRDEIVFGAMAIDDDGTPLWNTGLGHGDAMHLSDFDPSRPGLEYFKVDENKTATYGLYMADAGSGEILWGVYTGRDTGRGTAGDIDPSQAGAEAWANGAVYSAGGTQLAATAPVANFVINWDGDLGQEILDHTYDSTISAGVGNIQKWDPATQTTTTLLTATGTLSNNTTKGTPALQADLFGDWREEVIWRTTDSSALRIYETPYPTTHRLRTLMHDPVYRLSVAWQNVGYNQPPHTSYFLGYDMTPPPAPLLYTPGHLRTARVELSPAPSRTSHGNSGVDASVRVDGEALASTARAFVDGREVPVTQRSSDPAAQLALRLGWTPDGGAHDVRITGYLRNGDSFAARTTLVAR
ncbi:MAG: rhamnogalacturonan lyase [Solimonas sp.]